MSEPITLVLGGMGVKGVTSIGVLQSLRKHRVKVKKIIASGLSALVSAQWALGKDPGILIDGITRFFEENRRSLWGLEQLTGMLLSRRRYIVGSFAYFLRERSYCHATIKHTGALSWDTAQPQINSLLTNKSFSDLKVSLGISALDFMREKHVLLEEGRLDEAVKASLALPGLLPPVVIGNTDLVSSVIFCELPLVHIRKEDSPVLTFDVPSIYSGSKPYSILEIISTVDDIRNRAIKQKLLAKTDYLFRFEHMKRFYWGNYEQIPQIVDLARQETEKFLKNISLP